MPHGGRASLISVHNNPPCRGHLYGENAGWASRDCYRRGSRTRCRQASLCPILLGNAACFHMHLTTWKCFAARQDTSFALSTACGRPTCRCKSERLTNSRSILRALARSPYRAADAARPRRRGDRMNRREDVLGEFSNCRIADVYCW
jgi:hypothetical protein